MEKHIIFGQLDHFFGLSSLSLPLPVTLSQPSFILGVTVMATNPTLPSVGVFRGLEDFFSGGNRSFWDPSRDAQTALGVGDSVQSPQHQDK